MEEKPIECSGCQKEAHITYKEIVNGKVTSFKMCSNCPLLKSKLGITECSSNSQLPFHKGELKCDHCGTDLQSFKVGEGLGCTKCYKTFEDVLLQELSQLEASPINPESTKAKKRRVSLHLGRSPEKSDSKGISSQIQTLNIALGEALALENYEQAATIRDQIKTLMKQNNG